MSKFLDDLKLVGRAAIGKALPSIRMNLKEAELDIQNAIRELSPKMQELHDEFKKRGLLISYQVGKLPQ